MILLLAGVAAADRRPRPALHAVVAGRARARARERAGDDGDAPVLAHRPGQHLAGVRHPAARRDHREHRAGRRHGPGRAAGGAARGRSGQPVREPAAHVRPAAHHRRRHDRRRARSSTRSAPPCRPCSTSTCGCAARASTSAWRGRRRRARRRGPGEGPPARLPDRCPDAGAAGRRTGARLGARGAGRPRVRPPEPPRARAGVAARPAAEPSAAARIGNGRHRHPARRGPGGRARLGVAPCRRSARPATGGDRGACSTDGTRSAAWHRAAADAAAAAGDVRTAVLERFRAVVRELEERAVLAEQPGRTADEAARDAAARLPGLGERLTAAARIFDDVRYGDRPATAAMDEALRELDAALRGGAPRPAGSRSGRSARSRGVTTVARDAAAAAALPDRRRRRRRGRGGDRGLPQPRAARGISTRTPPAARAAARSRASWIGRA